MADEFTPQVGDVIVDGLERTTVFASGCGRVFVYDGGVMAVYDGGDHPSFVPKLKPVPWQSIAGHAKVFRDGQRVWPRSE